MIFLKDLKKTQDDLGQFKDIQDSFFYSKSGNPLTKFTAQRKFNVFQNLESNDFVVKCY